jgi:probable phosphomutase (TIGR03848 family)
MATIILVRHGENDYVKKGKLAGRKPGVHLNKKGQEQAEAAAQALCQMLREASPKAVFSSPLERTIETAAPIAEAFGLEVIPRPGLIETDYGDWTDKSVKQLSRLKLWRVVQHSPSVFRFPGGETFAEAQSRICQELQELAGSYEQKDVLICISHADPIKLAVAYYMGLPIDLFQRVNVFPTSITVLGISDTGSHLVTLNCIPGFSLPKA